MQKSMTGFGKAEASAANKKFTVEVRSLNSKQLDLSVKIPVAYRSAEFEIRAMAQKILLRGKVDILVSVETQTAENSAAINTPLFGLYLEQLKQAAVQSGMNVSDDTLLQTVMRMPNVIEQATESVSEQEQQAICDAALRAIENLDAFRKQEGEILIADLRKRVDLIEQYRRDIIPYEAQRCETIRTRIREQIEKAGLKPDNDRLEQEMIFYIEKLDITEEKIRLENHCKYFHEVAQTEASAGRKLGFIAQEMGREINTTGSKANNTEIQILVVKMKDELEKIKEQVLNLL